MKSTSVRMVLAISLVFIFIIGPATAGVFDQLEGSIQEKSYLRESAKVLAFKSSDQYSLLEYKFAKHVDGFADSSLIAKSDIVEFDLFEKNLWTVLPAAGPHCSSCGFNNATRSFGSVFTEEYKTSLSKFYFGAAGGGGAPGGGGGCCG